MKFWRGKKIIFAVCALIAILGSVKIIVDRVFCYDSNVAHPHIAELAVDLYNQNFDPDLTKEDIQCILAGAREEDTPTRWLNHFYDPVYNRGLKGVYSSAKSWAENPSKQSSYALGDQSWQRALDDYKNDDKKKAFTELGHVLHLIADMSVPAHTRNDVHVMPGDSYEQFLKNNWNTVTVGVAEKSKVRSVSSLSSAFDALATYSNSNFYSDDTIEESEYKKIFVDDYEKIKANDGKIWWLARLNINGGVNYLYKEDRTSGWGDVWNQNYSDGVQKKTMDSSVIITNHTSLLVPEAVGYSAGVIKLFFSEALRQSSGQAQKLPTFRQNILGFANLAVGKIVQTAQGIGDAMKARFGGGSGEVYGEDVPVITNHDADNTTQTVSETTPKAGDADTISPYQGETKRGSGESNVVTTDTVNTDNTDDGVQDSNNTPQPTASTTFVVTPPVIVTAPVVYSYGGGGGGGGGGSSQTPNSDNQTPATTALAVTPTTTPVGVTPTTTPEIVTPTSTLPQPEAGQPLAEIETPTSTPPAPIVPPEIAIISHASSTVTAASSTVIFGTKNEATDYIMMNNTTSSMQYPSSTAWGIEIDLNEGENVLEFFGENDGLFTDILQITIFLDTTAPPVPVVTAVQTEFATPTIAIAWSSADAVLYDVQKKVGTGEWEDIATSTASKTMSVATKRLEDISFRVRGYDKLGNVSDWSAGAGLTPDWPKTVVINEVAWMGTGKSSATAADEWIELYNNTDSNIDLTGWKLFVSGNPIVWNNVSSTIPARGYYLLERTDDNTIVGVPANATYTLSGGLSNTGEKLVLSNKSNETIDEVNCSFGWYAGRIDGWKYRPMGRLDSNQPGSSASNWQTSESIAPKARPDGGGVIFGSPGYSNKGYWLLQDDLTIYYSHLVKDSSLTLTKENSPYIIDYSTLIPAGFTLNINPGVVLVGIDKSSYINVKGVLNINGAAGEPVVFTSALDTNFVQQNFSTLTSSTPQAGDWSRIEISSTGKLKSSNARFYYGGAEFKKQGNWVYSQKNISQVIRNIAGIAEIDHSTFYQSFIGAKDQQYNAVVWTETLWGKSASTTVKNSEFDGGWMAIKNFGQNDGQKIYSEISSNQFKNFLSPDGPVVATYHLPALADNVLTGNNKDSIFLDVVSLPSDTTLANGDYLINGFLNVPFGMTLTVNSGVNLKMKLSAGIDVFGKLIISGTDSAPVNIEPAGDDYWGRLDFKPGAAGDIKFAHLRKGNFTQGTKPEDTGIVRASNAVLNIENCAFLDAARPQNMLLLNNSQTTIKNSRVAWSTDFEPSALRWITGITVLNGALRVDNVNFDRMDVAVDASVGGTVEKDNMPDENFQNIKKYNWLPEDLFTTLAPLDYAEQAPPPLEEIPAL